MMATFMRCLEEPLVVVMIKSFQARSPAAADDST
jgi:hypothetical protein